MENWGILAATRARGRVRRRAARRIDSRAAPGQPAERAILPRTLLLHDLRGARARVGGPLRGRSRRAHRVAQCRGLSLPERSLCDALLAIVALSTWHTELARRIARTNDQPDSGTLAERTVDRRAATPDRANPRRRCLHRAGRHRPRSAGPFAVRRSRAAICLDHRRSGDGRGANAGGHARVRQILECGVPRGERRAPHALADRSGVGGAQGVAGRHDPRDDCPFAWEVPQDSRAAGRQRSMPSFTSRTGPRRSSGPGISVCTCKFEPVKNADDSAAFRR